MNGSRTRRLNLTERHVAKFGAGNPKRPPEDPPNQGSRFRLQACCGNYEISLVVCSVFIEPSGGQAACLAFTLLRGNSMSSRADRVFVPRLLSLTVISIASLAWAQGPRPVVTDPR